MLPDLLVGFGEGDREERKGKGWEKRWGGREESNVTALAIHQCSKDLGSLCPACVCVCVRWTAPAVPGDERLHAVWREWVWQLYSICDSYWLTWSQTGRQMVV